MIIEVGKLFRREVVKKGNFLAFLILSIIPLSCLANYSPIVSIGFGADSINRHLNQNITIISPYQNTYNSGGNDLQPVGSLFVGIESSFFQSYFGQLGVGYYQDQAFTITGSIYQFTDPSLNNLAYQYHLKNRRLLLETKLLSTFQEIFHPYITAGIGEGLNQAYQYQEIPVDTDSVPMSIGFSNRTYHTFTYQVGLGLDVDITKNTRFGAGYRYLDLGRAGLGTTPLQDGNQTIKYNHLHANEFLMQLSYKF